MWTRGRNLQDKEAALRYRLQMATITRTGTVEVADGDGERMAEMLMGHNDNGEVIDVS